MEVLAYDVQLRSENELRATADRSICRARFTAFKVFLKGDSLHLRACGNQRPKMEVLDLLHAFFLLLRD